MGVWKMIVDVAWWELEGTSQTVESLRQSLKDSDVQAWSSVDELLLKLWIADRARNRWGAIMIWNDHRPANGALPPNLASELIGQPPSQRTQFEVATSASPLQQVRDLFHADDHVVLSDDFGEDSRQC
jgi:hypothetical protein